MKIATIIVRILLGLMFLFASISYFVMPAPPVPEGQMKVYMDGLAASGYIMQVVKVVELLCGLAFVIGRFVPLANLVIFPISVNILLTHVFLAPETVAIAAAVFAANVFLIYAYRNHYSGVLAAK